MLVSPRLQRWVVRAHTRAFEHVLAEHPNPRHIVIIGGGLFPRTALVFRRLLPHARLTIIDANRANLEQARALLQDSAIQFVHARFFADVEVDCDLLVLPLAFDGDRRCVYARPATPLVVVHDWIWNKRGTSRLVSPLLLKRLNLVRR